MSEMSEGQLDSLAAAAQPGTSGELTNEVTLLLRELEQGNEAAMKRLLTIVYPELRRIAARQLRRERRGHTLEPTALVHEVYLQLVEQSGLRLESRAHLLALTANVMRRILVHHARRRRAAKREGGLVQVTLDDAVRGVDSLDVDVLALNRALDDLARRDDRLVRVVELRYFGGLSIPETAEVLGVGTATVEREWRAARAWLHRALRGYDE
jgi:RNA polymerase sigma-70 factor, ECF subfamily